MPETWPFAEQDLTDRKRHASGRGEGASHEIGRNGETASRGLTPTHGPRALLLAFFISGLGNQIVLGAQSKMEPKQPSRFRTSEEKVDRKIKLSPQTPSEGIARGLVIAYGHPIPPPYKFAFTEDSLTANGIQVWPTLIQRNPSDAPPKMSPGTDVVAKEFPRVIKKARTLYWQLKGKVPEAELNETVRKGVLENRHVLDARWDSNKVLAIRFVGVPDGGRYRYTITFGDKSRLPTASSERPASDPASEKRLAGIEKSLRQGECVIFPSTMGGTIHVRVSAAEVMRIMESDADRSAKIDALEKMVRSLPAALDILENYDAAEWKSISKL